MSGSTLPQADKPVAAKTLLSPRGSATIHLDALRGFAAFAVMVSHWRGTFLAQYTDIDSKNFFASTSGILLDLGHQWVIVFFVLSGYLVGGSTLRAMQRGTWTWPAYLLTRMTRLYTVLIPALVLGGLLDWLGIPRANAEVLSGLHKTLTWPAFFGNFFFLQTTDVGGRLIHGMLYFGSNGVLWSLSCEFWYYLAFPALVFAVSKTTSWRMRLPCALALCAWGWLVGPFIALLGIPWMMGVLISYMPDCPSLQLRGRNLAITLSMLVFLGVLVISRIHSRQWLIMDMILGLVVATLIWTIVSQCDSKLPAWYTTLSKAMAQRSYTLYLFHVPFLVFLSVFFGLPTSMTSWNPFLVSVGELIAVLLYVQLVYLAFERNTDRLRYWLQNPLSSRPAS